MEFRIADTVTDSLARLSGEEQKAVKTTAFDLQIKPAQPGLQFHKLDKARDTSFWSVRVSSDGFFSNHFRCPRAFVHAQNQLPDIASDPYAGRTSFGRGSYRCGRQQGIAD
jgi:hypothetical protein